MCASVFSHFYFNASMLICVHLSPQRICFHTQQFLCRLVLLLFWVYREYSFEWVQKKKYRQMKIHERHSQFEKTALLHTHTAQGHLRLKRLNQNSNRWERCWEWQIKYKPKMKNWISMKPCIFGAGVHCSFSSLFSRLLNIKHKLTVIVACLIRNSNGCEWHLEMEINLRSI